MTIAPFAFAVFARVNSPKARPAWKACGQSLWALSARVLLRAWIDHILSTLSAPRRKANMPARRRSDEWGLRGGGPAWPRRGTASALRGRIRNAEIRIHASGFARGASNPKPSLDIPDRNCRTIGTLLSAQGRIRALDYAPEVSAEVISSCANIVALAGAEQMGEAISTGADLVVAGRATDTAGIAAMPLMNGEDTGAAWHSAKIAECGALCSTKPLSGVVVVEVDKSGFSVEPVSRDARCTPETVSAHMLYENADPFRLHEPGGMLDASRARYEAMDSRRVRVTGSEWIPAESYAVKLEGAAVAGYQTTILVVVRNPRYVGRVHDWSKKLQAFVKAEIKSRTGREEDTYAFEFRLIGLDSALGDLEFSSSAPAEVGVLAIMTAESQEAANELAKLANPFLLHFPLDGDEELPTFAFPYSPAETERGRQYEFRLNHALELDDPMDAFRLEVMEVGRG